MYIRFQLLDLQNKYTNLYPGVGNFPRCDVVARRVARLLVLNGHTQAHAYDCATNGLVWRVSAETVSPLATFCVWVFDILSPNEVSEVWANYRNGDGPEVSHFRLPADYFWGRNGPTVS